MNQTAFLSETELKSILKRPVNFETVLFPYPTANRVGRMSFIPHRLIQGTFQN